MAGRRNYGQECPIATGLDVLGERWTLLIVRELVGGARRYSDLRAELPGIATNLLAQRLTEMEAAGIVERTELPPPIARTVYILSDDGWRFVLPVLGALARYGLHTMGGRAKQARTPLNGFLVGVLLGFDAGAAADVTATYRAQIDDRRFDFAVTGGRLGAAQREPDVTLTASAADLITARLGSTEAQRRTARRRLTFRGRADDVDTMRAVLRLSDSASQKAEAAPAGSH